MVVKYTLTACWIAATPKAIARWVLPTPGGPSNRMFSPLATKRRVANSCTCRSLMVG